MFYYNKTEDAEFKSQWERTRIQTFFLINIQLDKEKKLSYEKFKREIWTFFWEKNEKKETDIESYMNMEQWQELINKPVVSSKEVDANDNIVI